MRGLAYHQSGHAIELSAIVRSKPPCTPGSASVWRIDCRGAPRGLTLQRIFGGDLVISAENRRLYYAQWTATQCSLRLWRRSGCAKKATSQSRSSSYWAAPPTYTIPASDPQLAHSRPSKFDPFAMALSRCDCLGRRKGPVA